MDNQQNWNIEDEEKKRKERRLVIVVIAILCGLVLTLFALVGSLSYKVMQTWKESLAEQKEKQNQEPAVPTVTPAQARITEVATATPTVTPTEIPMDPYLAERLGLAEEKEVLESVLGVSYDGAWPVKNGSMSCIVKKDGKWGLVSVTGEVLVPVKYERYSYRDNTGWVEFEKDGCFYVYDEQGKFVRVYSDKTAYRMESEEAYLFRTAKAYMSGMVIKTIIPEIEGDDYYGVEYRNKETGELLYSAVGGYEEAGIFTFPDETGRAVAIRGDGLTNTIYYITENGCESRVMELPEGVNGRWFDFVGDYTWADISLSQGWIKVYVCDLVPAFLRDKQESYLAFLNVDTLELVRFPEEYQTYLTIYDMGYGDTMAIRLYDEQDEYYTYAICKGDKVLTQEKYYWVEYDEKYMIAGHDNGDDILNYEGEVLCTFWDTSGVFANGKMLVWDENGLYFLDETLNRCSEYLLPGQEIESVFARGIVINGHYYFLKEFAMQELPAEGISIPEPEKRSPTEIPVKMAEGSYELVEMAAEVYRYLEDVYIIREGECYGMADLEGNILVQPVYNKWVYSDRDWVSFEDAMEVTYVFDHAGKELYRYVCNEGVLTTKEGQQFNRAIFYRQGMKIVYDYNDTDNYYGIHYYNATTGELIFELTDAMQGLEENPQPDLLVTSMPDSTGTAVVIAGDGFENTMYKITRSGYTEETYRENFVERRFFMYSVHNVWNRTNLVDGWLFTTMVEERGELLSYSEEWTDVLYNIRTKERVPLPEKYQDWYGEFYQNSDGIYFGMAGESLYDYENGETDCLYYAVCHGSEMLTEELYQWINFGETYIIAGNNSFSHILDYEGNVLAEYRDVAFPFVDGKTLVCDETGAFYIDENLQRCSDYVMEDVDYCHPNFIRKGNRFYLIQWKKTEE